MLSENMLIELMEDEIDYVWGEYFAEYPERNQAEDTEVYLPNQDGENTIGLI